MRKILILLSVTLLLSSCLGEKKQDLVVPENDDNTIVEENQVDSVETNIKEEQVETEEGNIGIEEKTVEPKELKIEQKNTVHEVQDEKKVADPQHEEVSTEEENTEETDELIEDMIGDIDDIFKELEVE